MGELQNDDVGGGWADGKDCGCAAGNAAAWIMFTMTMFLSPMAVDPIEPTPGSLISGLRARRLRFMGFMVWSARSGRRSTDTLPSGEPKVSGLPDPARGGLYADRRGTQAPAWPEISTSRDGPYSRGQGTQDRSAYPCAGGRGRPRARLGRRSSRASSGFSLWKRGDLLQLLTGEASWCDHSPGGRRPTPKSGSTRAAHARWAVACQRRRVVARWLHLHARAVASLRACSGAWVSPWLSLGRLVPLPLALRSHSTTQDLGRPQALRIVRGLV